MLMQWQMADFRSDRRLMTVVPRSRAAAPGRRHCRNSFNIFRADSVSTRAPEGLASWGQKDRFGVLTVWKLVVLCAARWRRKVAGGGCKPAGLNDL